MSPDVCQRDTKKSSKSVAVLVQNGTGYAQLTWRHERRNRDILLQRRRLGHANFLQNVWGRTKKKVHQSHVMNIIVDPICNVAIKIDVYTWVSTTMCFQVTIVPSMPQPRLFDLNSRVLTQFTGGLLGRECVREKKEHQVSAFLLLNCSLINCTTFTVSKSNSANNYNDC